MATYDTLESSVESSRPVELYTFAQGSASYRYSSNESSITIGGTTWDGEAIGRNDIVQGADDRSRTLDITLPATNSFVSQFISTPPAQKITVSVIRLQIDETPSFTQTLIFKGVVRSVEFSDDGLTAVVHLQSIESDGSKIIPPYTFMGMCNHVLYGTGCGVSPSDHSFTGPVSAIDGDIVTLDGADASGVDFVGGFCKPVGTNDFRMILAQDGDDLTLLLPFQNDPTGSNVQAFAGCDHIVDSDCAVVFDNVKRFGGFPWVPEKNPFETGID